MQLSKNLSLAEVVRSESAKRRGINNMPTAEHLENLKELALNVFQPIRDHFKVPIHVSSGYRSRILNNAVNGAAKSQHCLGEAIDIDVDGTSITNKQVFEYIKENLDFDQLIWEFGNDLNPDWVHVSFNKESNKKQVLIAKRNGIKTYYTNF
ncbi:Peptidase M15A, C-terminal [uncultured Caudovirales phage]|uniref:Peptidase M15A, C-terminal n=1 Tax=uncultured Caudovirales phage TaxID=2100421 RepID=A0A6J5NEN9_9CAUD|nr:Peptidase M15A, C-terminal [uncultured Caudovirales phage]